jgi:hypothetical protein
MLYRASRSSRWFGVYVPGDVDVDVDVDADIEVDGDSDV